MVNATFQVIYQLFQHGIDYYTLPTWHSRGTGLYWESFEKVGYDPVQGREQVGIRRRIKVDEELPVKDEYRMFIQRFLDAYQEYQASERSIKRSYSAT
ncbi:hypothetical protein KSD_18320 [Ktedonobacter sp. SOSP1-85]|uniref:hypothetical protein n=1 Tax=Ktedonobacter sp. SOSP1-85 TaxID=2778367 RepID=UPI001915A5C2|nr:hypothetical protein [Ktedonobacter sp. SOSP1-85]GHO74061.1 hypothetical protein KSD_18320 [Ktedonobacter sp. SOSP1-85]